MNSIRKSLETTLFQGFCVAGAEGLDRMRRLRLAYLWFDDRNSCEFQYPSHRSSLKTVQRTVFLTLRPSRVQVHFTQYQNKNGYLSATVSVLAGAEGLEPLARGFGVAVGTLKSLIQKASLSLLWKFLLKTACRLMLY